MLGKLLMKRVGILRIKHCVFDFSEESYILYERSPHIPVLNNLGVGEAESIKRI